MGAKRIGFFGIPPVGCSPSQIILGGHPSEKCDPERNHASELFNSKMKMEIARLNAELNIYGLKLAYMDFYRYLLELAQKPALYGTLNYILK
jgi:hypothetical protein